MNSITQFVSHVSPPSSENACSQRGVGVVTPDQMKRTRTGRPCPLVVAVEDADVAGERADERRVERAGPAAVRPVDRPELRLGVEEAERHPDEAARVVGAELVLVPEPVEEEARGARRLELLPLVRSASRSRSHRFRTCHSPGQKSKSRALLIDGNPSR